MRSKKCTKGLVCLLCIAMCGYALTACGKTEEKNNDTVEMVNATAESEIVEQSDVITTEDIVEESTEEISSVEESTEETTSNNSQKVPPVKVRGIYISGPIAGTDKMDSLIDLVDQTELNAMVIDIKNDDGRVTYKMESDTVLNIEAGIGYIKDIDELVQKCKEKNIYLIARIVAFKDPYLAEKCPELAIQRKNGGIYKDKKGLAWVNPYNKQVWDYLVELGTQAANAGFDEIQFDYIRFSEEIKKSEVDFGSDSENISKTEIITQFAEYAHEELSKLGVYVAADVYGTIIDSKIDQDIVGQDYAAMASKLDYICPMVYPSHYANGVYGIKIPDAEPYRTINAAMNASRKALSEVPEEQRAIGRVWIQCFTASWVKGHISYGPKQIREQIRGAFDAGYDEWILWNASVNYSPKLFLTEEASEEQRQTWEIMKGKYVPEKPKYESTEETKPTEIPSTEQTVETEPTNLENVVPSFAIEVPEEKLQEEEQVSPSETPLLPQPTIPISTI